MSSNCDRNDPKTPLEVKLGGSWMRRDYEWQVNTKHDLILIKEVTGDCNGNCKFLGGSYTLRSSGWASSDIRCCHRLRIVLGEA